MEHNDKPSQTNLLFLQILLGFAGTVIVAYLGYLGVRATVETPIHATQTAEARSIPFSPTATTIVAATMKPMSENTIQVVEPTVGNHVPLIIKIAERKEYVGNDLFIHKDIYFTDSGGDAYTVAYKLISTTLNSSEITVKNDAVVASSVEQKYQAIVVGTWECGTRYKNYTIVLEARILDRAGNQSEPIIITFDCQ
jgi:hypothetical protein